MSPRSLFSEKVPMKTGESGAEESGNSSAAFQIIVLVRGARKMSAVDAQALLPYARMMSSCLSRP